MGRPGALPHALVAIVGSARPRGRITDGSADLERVRTAFDDLRIASSIPLPSPAHDALARLQHLTGAERCTLATTEVDGMLHKASAEDVLEMRGSLFRLACVGSPSAHPRVPIAGAHPRWMRCVSCGAELRPDVVFPGEPLRYLDLLTARMRKAELVLFVDLEPEVEQVLLPLAKRTPVEHLAGPVDRLVPALVGRWLGED